MRMLITGSRDIDSKDVVFNAIRDSPWNPDTLVHGAADGVDSIAHTYPVYTSQEVSTEHHPVPDWAWEKIGSSAGPMRNSYMVSNVDVVVAVWDGSSSGTRDAISKAQTDGIPVYKVTCDKRDGSWVSVSRELLEGDQSSLHDFE